MTDFTGGSAPDFTGGSAPDVVGAIAPIVFIAALGFVLRRRHLLDAKTLSACNIFLFIPALVFTNIYGREIAGGVFLRIALASIVVMGGMVVLLGTLARLLKLEGADLGAFMMTMFPNLGNFGLPVAMFGLGEEGLAFAVVVMVIGSGLQNSFGIYYAQRAYHGKTKALFQVFLYPMIYAFLLALILRQTGIAIPLPVSRAVTIMADAAIPVQLVLLGIQIAETRVERSRAVFVASAARLLGGPALGILAAMAAGLTGLAGQAFVVQMSGPVAVGMAAYGVQFGVAPRFLSSAVAWTFFFSLFTISALLYFLAYIPV